MWTKSRVTCLIGNPSRGFSPSCGAATAPSQLSRRVKNFVGYPPLSELAAAQRRELHEALLEADSFEDLPGRWQAAILKAKPQPAEASGRQ